jgi:Dyp-type peroxidase family
VELSEIVHLAPVKPGFIPDSELGGAPQAPLSYADRLRRVLEAFNAREEQGFPSVIRLFRGIHSASWALVDGDTRLLLNVTFDGDWHHYLRALAYEVPGFLQLIWGNCVGWKRVNGNPEHLFEFIQAHQVRANFLYAHHPDLNVRDVEWLKQLRKSVDGLGDATASRQALYAAVDRALAPRSKAERLESALDEYARLAKAQLPGKDPIRIAKIAFEDTLKKLYPAADYALAYREAFGVDPGLALPAPALLPPQLPLDAADAQGNVVRPFEHAHCARVFFLHFPAQAQRADESGCTPAQQWLHRLNQLDRLSVGFTPQGLRALGVPEAELADLPDAFRQGMRARATQLGDPDPNRLPALPEGVQPEHAGELHAVVLAYRCDPPAADDPDAAPEIVRQLQDLGCQVRARETGPLKYGDLCGALDRALSEVVQPILDATVQHGLVKLAQQDLHQPLIGRKAIEYFGFRDGIRQPIALDAQQRPVDPQALRHALHAGPSPLLRNGSFLVMRQLAQDTQAFWQSMEALSSRLGLGKAQEAAELAMGRRMDGTPLGRGGEQDEAFHDSDREGKVCPFHSHVRRVNPRIEKEPELNPTLVRRGMSYATHESQGLLFMAFNADIASQFEFIQRNWVQSGSHVTQTSGERDPIAGMPGASSPQRPARPNSGTSLAVGEKAVLVDLPAFVSLRWGEYFFVPGRKALESIARGGLAPLSEPRNEGAGFAPLLAPLLRQATPESLSEAKALVGKWLDEPHMATQFWQEVEAGRIPKLDRWVFVANPEQVRTIMSDESGRYSVSGYMDRMKTSSGKFFLGMDKGADYTREQATTVIIPGEESAARVEAIAYRAAFGFVAQMYEQTRLRALSTEQQTVDVNLQGLLAVALDAVWSRTLGLSGPSRLALLGWGKDLTRSLFRVAAGEADMAKAADAGHDFRQHVDSLLAAVDDAQLAAALRESRPGATQAILDAASAADAAPAARLKATAYRLCKALGAGSATDDAVARNLLNIVTGSLGATGKLFLDGLDAFRVQRGEQDGRLRLPEGTCSDHGQPLGPRSLYEKVIMDSLEKVRRGGPDSLYRVFTGAGTGRPELADLERSLTPGDTLVVWLGGMLALPPDKRAKPVHDYVFGAGFRSCPGMAMGKAIINGLLLALFDLPDLRAGAQSPPSVAFTFLPQPPAPRA